MKLMSFLRVKNLLGLLLLVPVVSCSGGEQADLKENSYDKEQLNFGDGYNTFSQTRARSCLLPFKMKTNTSATGYKVRSTMSLYSNAKEALNSIENRASAKASFFGVKLGAESGYVKEALQQSYNLYIVAKTTVERPSEMIESPTLSPVYADLLKTNPDQFFKECGMRFVSEGTVGAQYNAIVRISSSTSEQREEISAKLSASGFIGGAENEFKAKSFEKIQESKTLLLQEQDGGIGEGSSIPKDVAEILQRVASLPGQVNATNGRVVSLKFRKYDETVPTALIGKVTVPNIDDAVAKLDLAREKLEQYTLTLESLNYIASTPNDFPTANLAAEKDQTIAANRNLLAATKACLNSLSKCSLTDDFGSIDLSKYSALRNIVTTTLTGESNVFAGASDRSDQDLWGHVIVKISGNVEATPKQINFHVVGTFEETGDTAHETHGTADKLIPLYEAPEGWTIEKVVGKMHWPEIVNEVMYDDTRTFGGDNSPNIPGVFDVRADRHGDDLPNYAGFYARIRIQGFQIHLKRQ